VRRGTTEEDFAVKTKKNTEAAVKRKMKALGFVGWSGMGDFTPKDHLHHLETIEATQRKKRSRRKK